MAQIRSSQRLRTLLLDVILPLGNMLNQGVKSLAAVRGVRLSSLAEMMKMKSGDGETFQQFIITGLLTQSPHVSTLGCRCCCSHASTAVRVRARVFACCSCCNCKATFPRCCPATCRRCR